MCGLLAPLVFPLHMKSVGFFLTVLVPCPPCPPWLCANPRVVGRFHSMTVYRRDSIADIVRTNINSPVWVPEEVPVPAPVARKREGKHTTLLEVGWRRRVPPG